MFNKQIAWDFIQFISSEAAIRQYTQTTGEIAPLRAVLQEQVQDPEKEVFARQAVAGKNWLYTYDREAAEDALKDAINSVVNKTLTPEEALERAQNIVNQTMRGPVRE